ncbi:MAG: SAM-dependent methyltransferase [Phycisphaerae bacterium]
MADEPNFVSRAGQKLDAALAAFGLDVRDFLCADFGCNVGGFTDCLLQRGAAKVYAIDTGYGELAWKLRKDPRVVVMERTNAIYCPVAEMVDLVAIDVAWTPQELIVPAAMKWLKPPTPAGPGGRIISLLKPHYELARAEGRKPHAAISAERADSVRRDVCLRIEALGCAVRRWVPSPLKGKGGNAEFVLLLELRRPLA